MSDDATLLLPARFTVQELDSAQQQLIAAHGAERRLALDGSRVERIDSAAAQWLVLLLSQPAPRSVLSAACFSEPLRHSLASMGLNDAELMVG